MLKLVRLALTAAVVTAIVVRLRRRARMPQTPPSPPSERQPGGRAGMGAAWAGIALIVAVTLAAALVPTEAQEASSARARTHQAEQDALTAALLVSENDAQFPAPLATGPAVTPPPTPLPTPAPTGRPVPDLGCAPEPRPVRVRPIDPKVRRAVDRQWRRIERWLRANAPRSYRTLGAPGRARTIAIAEAQMGVDFPDDLRASLLRHDGSRGARAFGFGLSYDGAANLGIRRIRDAWRAECSRNRTDPAHGDWNGRMIPFVLFAERHGEDGVYAVVDSAAGTVGWDDTISGTAPRLPSYYALMRAVADALEQGTAVEGWRPAVRGGVLRWDNAKYGKP
ncbi:SMI1/KNR4 family protein [Nonomuraea sp. B10E15]|uniref:SMI1/KNR4 family protein n=1 Tax=Nonomuraea sp. B10E15 TaxID=3153560 RepID=UPI00325E79BB